MKCGFCGAVIPNDSLFCQKCGGAVEPVLVCVSCGTENKTDSAFCRRCGRSFSENGGTAVREVEPAVGTAVSEERENTVQSEPVQLRCRTCSKPVTEMMSNCPNCGTVNLAFRGERRCVNCGKVLREGAEVCVACGTMVEGAEQNIPSAQPRTANSGNGALWAKWIFRVVLFVIIAVILIRSGDDCAGSFGEGILEGSLTSVLEVGLVLALGGIVKLIAHIKNKNR